jgi:hypothetical protein
MEAHRLSINMYLASVGRLNARKNLHECALAGSIGPEKRMDLAVANGHVSGPQRHDGSIRFCNIGGRE